MFRYGVYIRESRECPSSVTLPQVKLGTSCSGAIAVMKRKCKNNTAVIARQEARQAVIFKFFVPCILFVFIRIFVGVGSYKDIHEL